jgi:tetratricopeptide (TPR) repeat protein
MRRSIGVIVLLLMTFQAHASGQSVGREVAATPAPMVMGTSGNGNSHNETPLYGNLGPHARTIVTPSDRAQAYFNEGLLFMYAFGTSIAEESFGAAREEDPECAACYWGEAWALAPYLNGGMSPGNERKAYAAIERAKEFSSNASAVEQALIDAFSLRYEAEPDRNRRKMLDTLYAREMKNVAQQFPDDLDVQTLYAEAWMLLRPRRGDVDLNASDVQHILPILEGVLARDIRHPGACHLYIHLVEASPEPGKAETCSNYLGSSIAVSHIHHMPSHIFMNIGRWGDAVTSNQQAWHADQKADYGGPPGVYPSHNLHMLLNAAVMDGQSAVAMQAAKDLARHPGPWAWYIPLTYTVFGRWPEILETNADPDGPTNVVGWSFARGMAHLRTGDPQAASENLAKIDAVIAEADDGDQFRFHSIKDVLALPRAILAAEIAHADGRSEEAIEILDVAIEIEDGLLYSEPEAWHIPIRNVLGAIQLDMGRAADAEVTYRAAIEDHPNQGWGLFGLEEALTAQGKTTQAQEAKRDFEKYWARADIWLRSSRF